MEKIKQLLNGLYSLGEIEYILKGIEALWEKYSSIIRKPDYKLTEEDVVLITYGDQLYRKGEDKLQTLKLALDSYLTDQVSIVHILPFYPFTSDDGFSITDYYAVDPGLGNWDEIEKLSKDFKLLFDAVINHNSSESDWFKGFLNGDESFKEYYVEEDSLAGFSEVVRPRTSPLIHTFQGKERAFNVWTTFSRDQVDLNYKNPRVLLHILDLLLFYVSKGASIIRLDAVGFLWKEKNTTCIHLEQTHKIIKLTRQVIGHLNPSVMLLTETNVPHKDNISYFGDGNEAHMVYNFTLPPLLAFSLLNQTTEKLQKWISELIVPYNNVCYFNFLASHDGVGVMPVHNILNDAELDVLINSAKANGGKVSYKSIGEGKEVPYEINCNYLSLLFGPQNDEALGMKRSLLAHAILLTMPGLPAIYFHSIFGSVNDIEGLKASGQNRRINREKFNYDQWTTLLDDPTSRQAIILDKIKSLIDLRKIEKAFDPYGSFEVLDTPNGVLGICRTCDPQNESVYGYFNITQEPMEMPLSGSGWLDIVTKTSFSAILTLNPLSFVWLKKGK